MSSTRVNLGADIQAAQMGGDTLGAAGTASSPTATGFTCSGLTAGAHVGHLVTLGGVWGVITANSATSVTVDQWYTPGLANTTPASTPGGGPFVILPGNAPCVFMALSTTNAAPVATDTSLAGEITTAGGGLVRRLAAFAHTAGATSYTMTGTYTMNAADVAAASPQTVYRLGMCNSAVPATGRMQFETALSASATVTAAGDQITITQTVNM